LKNTKMPRWSARGAGRWRKRRGNAMKIILVAVAMVAFLAGPGYAQVPYSQENQGKWNEQIEATRKKEREEKEKRLDVDFKAKGDRIPEPKVKLDPWKNAR